MRTYFDKTLFPMAIAIFSMFFGAGNAIFPLLLGQQSQGQYLWAFGGLVLTAIEGLCWAFLLLRYTGGVASTFSLGQGGSPARC